MTVPKAGEPGSLFHEVMNADPVWGLIQPPLGLPVPEPPHDAWFFWWKFVHNALLHPLLSLPWEPRWVQRAHDWTATRCYGAG